VRDFPPGLAPVQVDDDGGTLDEMGRGALRVRVTADGRDVDLITAHLKSKLLTFPGERFEPRDEDERARFAGYALYRRASEAVTLRAYANGLLEGEGRERAVMFSATSTTSRAQPPPRSCWARRDRKSVRLASIATTRATAGGSGTSRRGSRAAALQSAVSRSRRTNRPSAGQPSARPPCRRSRNRSRSSSLDHRGSDQPPGRSRVGSPSGVGSLRPGLTARTSPVQTRLARTIPVRWPLGGVSAICIWSWLTRGGRIPARVRDARRRPGPALISLSGQKVAHYLNEVHGRPWAAGT
jgi:hypothetical protein